MMHSTLVRAVLFGVALLTAAAPAAAQVAANGDIILHAQRATVISGAWGLVSDATAASGMRLANPDAGAPKRETALASPSDYFELKFTPEAGRAYRLWMRSKAQSNSWTNDSVFVQFSGSENAAGSAAYRIGTTSAAMYTLEEGSGAGLSGWGWQDNGYGYGVLGPEIYFNGATQTIRVQSREDGISIDQIVLSPVKYVASAPGALKNDATILAEPSTSTTAPSTTASSWGALVNATASGMTIKKSGGCGSCPDAGGVMAGQVTGSVSFTVSSGHSLVAGLNTDSSANTGYGLKYAFSFEGSNLFEIREGGVYKTEGTFSASDVFKVSIEGTKVKYYRNGTLVYTSATAVPGALYVDASLVSTGASVTVTALNGSGGTTTPTPTPTPTPAPTGGAITWASKVNATASGALLKKSGGCGTCPDAGAVSQQQITSGGSVSFTVGAGHQLLAGLGRNSASTSPSFDYAFSFDGGSIFEIREFGIYKAEGAFGPADVFTVTVEGSAAKYYRNGSLVYTSKTAVPGAMVVDTTLVSAGANVTVTGLNVGSGTTAPAPAPEPAPAPAPAPAPTTGKLLRVLHWSTYHGGFRTDGVYDPDLTATWIANLQPDVVFLTEIEKYTGWGNADQPAVIKNLLQQKTGKTWYYLWAQEYGDWSGNGKGNMILSTYPISYTDRYLLVNNADRSIGLAAITVNGKPITLMMTHLDPYDASLRLTQAKEVTAYAAPQPENRILAGDMNAWPDQSSIAHYNTLYNDSWTVALNNGTASSFSGNNGETKNGRIDYIFYSKKSTNLFVKSSKVYDTTDSNGVMASDHRPLLTVFEVR